MSGDQFYPFERNRYYYGKLLTTSDLEAEQKYINGKRQFINKVMFGTGRICGLKVYHVNEDTLMIESGFAIDDEGREIIVDQSGIKKISSIEGFDNIRSEKMLLTISYNETLTQPVYSVAQNSDSKGYEYNKINENFKLKLKEYVEFNDFNHLEDEIVVIRDIYSDENYKICIKIPTVATKQADLKIITCIEKLTDINETINLSYTINIPGFIADDDSEKLFVNIKDLLLSNDKYYEYESWIKPSKVLSQDTVTFAIKKEDIKITIGSKKQSVDENILFQLNVSDNDPIELIKTKVKNESLENLMKVKERNDIVLAVIKVMRVGTNCIIQDVQVPLESKYSVQMPAQLPYINKMMSYYKKNNNLATIRKYSEDDRADNQKTDMEFRRKIESMISSGVFEMPLGMNVKANKTILSDEIMHNLGPGNVCVNVGFEFVMPARDKKETFIRKIIFGDAAIFKGEGVTWPSVSTGVEVLCEKGTFIVGLKFAEVASVVSVKIRWFAYKQPEIALNWSKDNGEGKGIFVKQDTIKLIPNEIHFLEIGFRNMNPTALRYEVIDKDGGEIDENGCYAAPNKEGVYEIKISCISEPSIYTFAYAVVMKKDADQQ